MATKIIAPGLALALALAAGCRIPDEGFQATPDAEVPDGGGDELAIVPSATALTVDENGSKELTVKLSRPPAAPLTVQVDSPSTAIGLTIPDMTFTAANFDQPRTIVVAGLADQNVADAQADITLTATGLPPVTVAATVDDLDVVTLVTNVAANNIVEVNGGQAVDVRVRLSHQPDSDVTVQVILGAGPCSVNVMSRVFTPQGYDTDQTFRFTAADDPNITNDAQSLTLRLDAGLGPVDRQYTLQEIDDDVLNFDVSPASLTVGEQGTAGNLNVALTQQPPANVTVTVSVMSQTGVVTVDKNQLTFTPQNYATNQTVQVTGADDADIDNDTAKVVFTAGGIPTREVTVTITDNDAQAIETDVLSELSVDENAEITFGVRLKQEPSASVNVSVSSLATGVATVTQGSLLSFTPQNYNVLQTVRVKGTKDNNLAVNSTKIRALLGAIQKEVTVNVNDLDEQELLVTPPTLAIPEGGQGSFTVALRFEPLSTVTAMISSTNATALPVSATQLTFTTTNYATAQTVNVNPPVDSNAAAETSTITVSGAGAAQSKIVMAMVNDATDIDLWGWPMPFPGTTSVTAGFAIGYKVDVGAVANLDSFHTYVPTATGSFRMALYTDNAGVPGTLVAEMGAGKVLVNGVNDGPILTDPLLSNPSYFVVIRFSQNVGIGYAPAGTTGRQCFRNVPISSISDPWPASFGASTCATDRLMNMWITTYHQ